MKDLDTDGIILILLGIFVSTILFWNIIKVIQKSFTSPDVKVESSNPLRSSQIIPSSPKQDLKTKNARELEKEYMRKQRQKMRDYRR